MRHFVNTLLTLLTGALLLGSCQEKPQIKEEISVNPTTIAAKVTLASYKIAVQSNAAWAVAVEGSPNWLTLDRSSGHDDATVTVRVLENK